MSRIFDSLSIGNVTLKNRIVFAPTSLGPVGMDFYESIAAGGCGLFVMADLSVIPSMLGGPSLNQEEYKPWFQEVLEIFHRYGCKVCAQLFHPEYDAAAIGRLYQKARTDGSVTPDEARQKLAESTQTYCDELTKEEIKDLVHSFASTAKKAKEYGFDMVQIHGDRLIGSFTSPLFNHRKDEYGSHSYLPEQVVKAVREAVPGFLIDYKLTIRLEDEKLGRGGISMEEVPQFVRILDACGVGSYHVTLANHTDTADTIPVKNHPKLSQEGCFQNLALEVKKYTKRPVCTVGKLQHLDYMEALLSQGIDLIGMSRQLIADPKWPLKMQSGQGDSIQYCIYCNKKCLGALKTGSEVQCILNQP